MLARRREEEEENERYIRPLQPQQSSREILRHPALNKKLRSRCFMILALLIVMAMTVTIRSGIASSRGYELVKLQSEADKIAQENERLKIEIAHKKSPERIRSIAEKQLGMTMPQNVYFGEGAKKR